MSAMRAFRFIAFIIGVSVGLVMSAAWVSNSEAGAASLGEDETPNCATLNEYDRIESFMYPWRVAEIVGYDGWHVDTPNPDSFARGYRSCWAPGERMVRVWFEQDSRFSYDKAVLDVPGSRVGYSRVAPAVLDAGFPGPWDSQCWGRDVTIRGSLDGDTIVGTDRADVIFAYAGNDVILAGDGNDRVCGRWGADIINAGPGHDRVNGGMSDDLCLFAEATRKC